MSGRKLALAGESREALLPSIAQQTCVAVAIGKIASIPLKGAAGYLSDWRVHGQHGFDKSPFTAVAT